MVAGQREEISTLNVSFNVRGKGISSNLDKKRTILENLRRNANTGNPGIHHMEDIYKPHSNAVVIAIMDTSGSWGLSQLTKEKVCLGLWA